MTTIVLSGLTLVVVLLTVLVVGLLRSHAAIVRALHNAGVNLDPDRPDRDLDHHRPGGHQHGDHRHGHHEHDHNRPGHRSESNANSTLVTDTPPTIRTVEGVPEPVDRDEIRANDIVGDTPMGGTRSIAVQGQSNTLLAFLSTGCGTCAQFWNSFKQGVSLPESTRLVIITQSDNSESPADVAALAPSAYTTIMSSKAWDDYRVPVAPYFVMVSGGNGLIAGEGAAHSWDLVDRLLGRAVADAAAARVPERKSRRDLLLGRSRANDIDRQLLRAGIGPGDARLHHDGASPHDGDQVGAGGVLDLNQSDRP